MIYAANIPTQPPAAMAWPLRLKALGCVLLGALLLMSTAFASGRPSMFFDTDGYYLMGENVVQVIKRMPAVLRGDHAAMTTPVSDDDEIDITIMGARSPWYGAFLYGIERVGGIWSVAGAQALICAWMIYLLWRGAAPGAAHWTYVALMAGLTAGSTLPFFSTFIMPDVFAGAAAAGFVLLTVFADRLTRIETTIVFLLLAFAYSVHTSHMLTVIAAIVPALIVLLILKAPRRQVFTGVALCVAAMVVSVLGAKLYAAAFEMRNDHKLQRPPFLMARVLADGPGRAYLRKVCKGRDNPYVLCRALNTPLTKSDDILWEDSAKLGAFNALKSPDLQLVMEAQEMDFVKGAVLNDPMGQLNASLRNWLDQFTRISSHDPLRDPRQFLANEYWKTTRLIDLIPNPRQCKPIGPGCKPPFDIRLVKYWHELVIGLSLLFAAWRLSRPDVRADLADRKAPWLRRSIPLIAAAILLMGMLVINAGVCGVISGAFSRYQARIVWLVPAVAGLIACGLGLAWPAAWRRGTGLRRDQARGPKPLQPASGLAPGRRRRLADRVGHARAPGSYRKGLPGGGIPHRLVLHFCVQLGAQQDHRHRQPHPRHEADHRAQRPIGDAVVGERADIPGKQQRHRQPAERRHHAAQRHPSPARMLAAGAIAVNHRHAADHHQHQDRPAQGDEETGFGVQVQHIEDHWSGHHGPHHQQHEAQDGQREAQADQVQGDEASLFLFLVGDVQPLEQRLDPGVRAPQRKRQGDGEGDAQAGRFGGGDADHFVADEGQAVGRQHPGQQRQMLLGVADVGIEAVERHEGRHAGEQGQDAVEGHAGRHAGDLVVVEFDPGAQTMSFQPAAGISCGVFARRPRPCSRSSRPRAFSPDLSRGHRLSITPSATQGARAKDVLRLGRKPVDRARTVFGLGKRAIQAFKDAGSDGFA